jgi:5-methylcytosine-specific restriction protein B
MEKSEIKLNPEDLFPSKEFNGINLDVLLKVINARVEKLLDRNHMIGHAFFINVLNIHDLKRVFKDKIIPLLQEYFYGDYGKIGLVLGKSFIHSDSDSGNSFVGFAKYDYEDSSVVSDLNERKVYSITPDESWDFQSIIQ